MTPDEQHRIFDRWIDQHKGLVFKAFTLTAPTISHHLKELANADLIITEKRGKFLVARVNRDTLAEVEQVLALVRSG